MAFRTDRQRKCVMAKMNSGKGSSLSPNIRVIGDAENKLSKVDLNNLIKEKKHVNDLIKFHNTSLSGDKSKLPELRRYKRSILARIKGVPVKREI